MYAELSLDIFSDGLQELPAVISFFMCSAYIQKNHKYFVT